MTEQLKKDEASSDSLGQTPIEETVLNLLMYTLHNWLERLTVLRELIAAETRLNFRAIIMLSGIFLLLLMIAVSLWLSVLTWIAAMIYWLIQSLPLAILTAVVFQGVVFWWLLVNMHTIRSKMGFSRSAEAVADIFKSTSTERAVEKTSTNSDSKAGAESPAGKSGC